MVQPAELFMQVDQDRLASWRESARRCNMTINDWLVMSITLADQLGLVEGATRLPNNGATIDPILAEAIRQAAAGKPWEHKATLLLGIKGLTTDIDHKKAPRALTITPAAVDAANDLMVQHGLPRTAKRGPKMHTHIAGGSYTWYETAILLLIHDRIENGWAAAPTADLAELCGISEDYIGKILKRLRILGRIEIQPARTMNQVRMVRLQPPIQRAISTGDIRLLTGIEQLESARKRKEETPAIEGAVDRDPRYVAMMDRIAAEHQKILDAGLIDH